MKGTFMKFYTCLKCNQIYITPEDDVSNLMCCDQNVQPVMSTPASGEDPDHTPLIRKTGNFITVTIGLNHPMVDVHRIKFICLETNCGFQYRAMPLHQVAKVTFILALDENMINVYSYCSVHGLRSLN
jgi:superoxide reductase